ncbi:MAG: GAF domain-containing protein [Desulfobacterales bacterium]|nr:GAF domain-containing protein [Desulfobacterales bacterium]
MNPYSIPPLVSIIAFSGLAILIGVRNGTSRVGRLFLPLCFLGAVLNADIFLIFNVSSPSTALWITRTGHVFTVFLIPAYIHFFHAYLHVQKRAWLIPFAYGYAVCLMALAPTPLLIAGVIRHPFGFFGLAGPLYPLVGIGAGAAIAYVMTLLHRAIKKEHRRLQRNRLRFVSAGFGFLGLVVGGNVLTGFGVALYPPGGFSFLPLAVFAYGLFRHDLLDMGLLFRRSLIYSTATALLTAGYALAVTLAEQVLKGFHFAGSFWAPVFFFLFVTVVFGPLRTRIQALLDLFFKKRQTAYQQTLLTVSRTIATVLDQDRIAGELLNTVADALGVDRCALYLSRSDGSGQALFAARPGADGPVFPIRANDLCELVDYLATEKIACREDAVVGPETKTPRTVRLALAAVDAAIALPLVFQARLSGFVLLGEKGSGDSFSPRDLSLLETLASQSAVAVENARAYKVIAEMNRGLEATVRARTAELESALAEKERSQELLIRSESLAAIGQLVAGTAHELNNPLTSVKSLLQSTIEDLTEWDGLQPPDNDLIEDLNFADRELSRARDIVASLLGLSRQTQTYAEAVDLTTVVRHALRVLGNLAKGGGIRIVENLDSDLPRIQGNFANLGQVVLNIVKNALQAAGGQGTVIVATRHDRSAGQVVFTCVDSGPGIDLAVRQDIFKPFFTTKAVGDGTGLGLYICHEILARHGGRILLIDAPDTTFEIRLPVAS